MPSFKQFEYSHQSTDLLRKMFSSLSVEFLHRSKRISKSINASNYRLTVWVCSTCWQIVPLASSQKLLFKLFSKSRLFVLVPEVIPTAWRNRTLLWWHHIDREGTQIEFFHLTLWKAKTSSWSFKTDCDLSTVQPCPTVKCETLSKR